MIKIFVKDYYAYIAIEFLESVIASGLYTVAVVLSKFLTRNYTIFIIFFAKVR